jgi:hypothetical protein
MSSLSHGANSTLALVRANIPQMESASLYLTDEVFLYRVVRLAAGDLVELEDCYRLDVVRIPVSDLRERRLRAVTPAQVDH